MQERKTAPAAFPPTYSDYFINCAFWRLFTVCKLHLPSKQFREYQISEEYQKKYLTFVYHFFQLLQPTLNITLTYSKKEGILSLRFYENNISLNMHDSFSIWMLWLYTFGFVEWQEGSFIGKGHYRTFKRCTHQREEVREYFLSSGTTCDLEWYPWTGLTGSFYGYG